jgi:hypothetical protein
MCAVPDTFTCQSSATDSAGRVWVVLPAGLPPILTEYGRRVASLGPGLTSDSADAARAVLRDDLPGRVPGFQAPADGAVPICRPVQEAGVHRSGGADGGDDASMRRQPPARLFAMTARNIASRAGRLIASPR